MVVFVRVFVDKYPLEYLLIEFFTRGIFKRVLSILPREWMFILSVVLTS